MSEDIREPQSGMEEQLARLAGEEVTPRPPQSAEEQWLELLYENGMGEDGITPVVTITAIAGGHNVAFSYGEDDPRNTNFDVLDGSDGAPGQDGAAGQDGDDGITPTVTITNITGGHNVSFYYGSGDSRNANFDVMDGATGQTGQTGPAGYSPVRGVDYWTSNDVTSMESYCAGYIDTQLGTIINGSY